jgi:hypothetical protein
MTVTAERTKGRTDFDDSNRGNQYSVAFPLQATRATSLWQVELRQLRRNWTLVRVVFYGEM